MFDYHIRLWHDPKARFFRVRALVPPVPQISERTMDLTTLGPLSGTLAYVKMNEDEAEQLATALWDAAQSVRRERACPTSLLSAPIRIASSNSAESSPPKPGSTSAATIAERSADIKYVGLTMTCAPELNSASNAVETIILLHPTRLTSKDRKSVMELVRDVLTVGNLVKKSHELTCLPTESTS